MSASVLEHQRLLKLKSSPISSVLIFPNLFSGVNPWIDVDGGVKFRRFLVETSREFVDQMLYGITTEDIAPNGKLRTLKPQCPLSAMLRATISKDSKEGILSLIVLEQRQSHEPFYRSKAITFGIEA